MIIHYFAPTLNRKSLLDQAKLPVREAPEGNCEKSKAGRKASSEAQERAEHAEHAEPRHPVAGGCHSRWRNRTVKAFPKLETRTPHDLDAGVLMAVTLSSKRRPAELVDIVAAVDLILGFVPFAEKLGAAIERLSSCGLIGMSAGGLTLTDAGLEMMSKQPRKASQEDLIAAVKSSLAAWRPRADHPPVLLAPEQLGAAVRGHKATRKMGKSVLMPRPAVTRHFKVAGRWRRAIKAG